MSMKGVTFFYDVEVRIGKHGDVHFAVARVERNVHVGCLVAGGKVQTNAYADKHVGIDLVTMRCVHLKTSEIVITCSDSITEVNKTTVAILNHILSAYADCGKHKRKKQCCFLHDNLFYVVFSLAKFASICAVYLHLT